LISVDPRKSAANIFLNCTKNTELTASPLARTFCFAPQNKKGNRTPAKTPTGQGSNTKQASYRSTTTAVIIENENEWLIANCQLLTGES